MSTIALKWSGQGSRMFIGRDSFGHVLLAGSWPGEGPEWQEWKAIKPSDLLLLSLASCSSYDVVMILERQRQDLHDLYVEVHGKQLPDPPYAFTEIHQHYVLEGYDLDPRKVERAIELSQEKYCSVAATIRGVANLTYSFEILLRGSTR
ncbi:MAG: OsmC family protein [Candidatus Promineifilaceae bacterium]|nr:OsmC family protein [Candidatus Promineifilaceae bacterium]